MAAAVKITRFDYTAADLRGLAAKSNDGAQVRRLLALAFVLDGQSREEAARRAGMDRQTLRDWVHRYNAEGVSGLKSVRSGGHPASLTSAQMAELKALTLEGPDPEKHKVVPVSRTGNSISPSPTTSPRSRRASPRWTFL